MEGSAQCSSTSTKNPGLSTIGGLSRVQFTDVVFVLNSPGCTLFHRMHSFFPFVCWKQSDWPLKSDVDALSGLYFVSIIDADIFIRFNWYGQNESHEHNSPFYHASNPSKIKIFLIFSQFVTHASYF